MRKLRYTTHTPCPVAVKAGGSRELPSKVYVLHEVQQFLVDGGKIYVQTPKASSDLLFLGWDTDDVRRLIGCLHDGCYHKSEWCLSGNTHWLDCDSYTICFDDSEGIEDTNFPEYYVKFGFANNVAYCGIISCHVS